MQCSAVLTEEELGEKVFLSLFQEVSRSCFAPAAMGRKLVLIAVLGMLCFAGRRGQETVCLASWASLQMVCRSSSCRLAVDYFTKATCLLKF